MKILVIEPFYTDSHQQWTDSFQHSSQHHVEILSLPGRYWKWRMHGAAVSLARQFIKSSFSPDLIIVSDMLDLSTFVALCRKSIDDIPVLLYFHENQITYPWSPDDQDIALKRNNQYGFINYTSALVADHVVFNSQYHLDSFLGELPAFLKQFPDHQELDNVALIREKSSVLHLGMNLKRFDQFQHSKKRKTPIILWNHRWEYDKNPDAFYDALRFLQIEAIDFELILLGKHYQKIPPAFTKIKEQFAEKIIHFGYAEHFENYAHLLWQADILPVTSNQDFFGGSVVEAIYCQCIPILPNRLAYPEHLPNHFQEHFLYNNNNEFHQKLKQSCLMNSRGDVNPMLSDFVARYDWSNLAEQYDQFFEQCKLE